MSCDCPACAFASADPDGVLAAEVAATLASIGRGAPPRAAPASPGSPRRSPAEIATLAEDVSSISRLVGRARAGSAAAEVASLRQIGHRVRGAREELRAAKTPRQRRGGRTPRRPKTPRQPPACAAVKDPMYACPVCWRAFVADSLAVHHRGCAGPDARTDERRAAWDGPELTPSLLERMGEPPKRGAGGAPRDREVWPSEDVEPARIAPGSIAWPPPEPRADARPRWDVVCYLCGGLHAPGDYASHESTCRARWTAREAMRPRTDTPRQVPDVPDAESAPLPDLALLAARDPAAGEALRAYNELARAAYASHGLVRCGVCSRTFFEESLATHSNGECGAAAAAGRAGDDGPVAAPVPIGPPPSFLACRLCGRLFGSASLARHQTSCRAAWLSARGEDPPDGGEVPEPPAREACASDAEFYRLVREHNAAAMESYYRRALYGCGSCGRGFFAESLDKHLRGCPGPDAGTEARLRDFCGELRYPDGGAPGDAGGAAPSAAPALVTCFCCGREFGRASVGIHTPQCVEMWRRRQELAPPAERRPEPEPPGVPLPPPGAPRRRVEEYNAAALDVFYRRSLASCVGCGRTFFEESCAKHMRGCAAAREAARGAPARAPAWLRRESPAFVACHLCGTLHGAHSIAIHLRQCADMWTKRGCGDLPEPPRLPLPPTDGGSGGAGAGAEHLEPSVRRRAIDAYNHEALDIYNAHALRRCAVCERSFTAEALEKHSVGCRPGSPLVAPAAGAGAGAGAGDAAPTAAGEVVEEEATATEEEAAALAEEEEEEEVAEDETVAAGEAEPEQVGDTEEDAAVRQKLGEISAELDSNSSRVSALRKSADALGSEPEDAAVDSVHRSSLELGEVLMQALLRLDGVELPETEARPALRKLRKDAVNQAQALLDAVDVVKRQAHPAVFALRERREEERKAAAAAGAKKASSCCVVQ